MGKITKEQTTDKGIKIEIGDNLYRLLNSMSTSQQILFALEAMFENMDKIEDKKGSKKV